MSGTMSRHEMDTYEHMIEEYGTGVGGSDHETVDPQQAKFRVQLAEGYMIALGADTPVRPTGYAQSTLNDAMLSTSGPGVAMNQIINLFDSSMFHLDLCSVLETDPELFESFAETAAIEIVDLMDGIDDMVSLSYHAAGEAVLDSQSDDPSVDMIAMSALAGIGYLEMFNAGSLMPTTGPTGTFKLFSFVKGAVALGLAGKEIITNINGGSSSIFEIDISYSDFYDGNNVGELWTHLSPVAAAMASMAPDNDSASSFADSVDDFGDQIINTANDMAAISWLCDVSVSRDEQQDTRGSAHPDTVAALNAIGLSPNSTPEQIREAGEGTNVFGGADNPHDAVMGMLIDSFDIVIQGNTERAGFSAENFNDFYTDVTVRQIVDNEVHTFNMTMHNYMPLYQDNDFGLDAISITDYQVMPVSDFAF